MASRWTNLTLAATAALSFGLSEDARAQNNVSIWPYHASEQVQAIPADTYPAISPELLDPGVADNKALQKAIIDDAARGKAIGSSMFDVGLSTDAAYTLTRGRNSGELPGAKDGQSPADWWRETEPKIFELMEDYKAERRLPYQIAGGIAGGFGLMLAGSAALGAYRRRKDGPPVTGDERLRQRFGPGSGP
ncbi:MAG: hypothetical protein AAF213_11360 [Pseudomonadota bacterium]